MAIDARWFDGEWRVVAVAPGNKAFLGWRVTAVDDMPVERVGELLRAFTPADEQPTLAGERVSGFLTTGMLLHGAGITRNRERARYTLQDDAGALTTVTIPATPSSGWGVARWPQQPYATTWPSRVAQCGVRLTSGKSG